MHFKESDLVGCIINAKLYLYKHEIPAEELPLLKLADKAEFRKGLIFMSTVFFHKPDEPNGYLSNFYPSVFELKGKTFSCVEQYMMWSKAITFRDEETAELVLQTIDPNEIKRLGRQVKGYKDSYWAAVRYEVVKEGILAKFSQNEDLKKKFLSTSGQFAECAKNDHVWGIGLDLNDPKRIDQLQWDGQNLLGFALREVYNELKGAM